MPTEGAAWTAGFASLVTEIPIRTVHAIRKRYGLRLQFELLDVEEKLLPATFADEREEKRKSIDRRRQQAPWGRFSFDDLTRLMIIRRLADFGFDLEQAVALVARYTITATDESEPYALEFTWTVGGPDGGENIECHKYKTREKFLALVGLTGFYGLNLVVILDNVRRDVEHRIAEVQAIETSDEDEPEVSE